MSHTIFETIQNKARDLSAARDYLSGQFSILQIQIDALKANHLPGITKTSRQLAKLTNELQSLISQNPELFDKPRSFVVDGLKFGLQKKVGSLSWENDDKLVHRIHALVEDGTLTFEQSQMLVTVIMKPVSKSLEKLDGRVLKRLGITIGADTDEPLIKSVDSEVEKAVNAVIKEATKDTAKDTGAQVPS